MRRTLLRLIEFGRLFQSDALAHYMAGMRHAGLIITRRWSTGDESAADARHAVANHGGHSTTVKGRQ